MCVSVCETLRFALRLSEGICRVTLYSVCRSSSSAMKQASCTRRFALTICSLKRLRLLTNTTSLMEVRRIIMRDTGERKGDNKEGSSSHIKMPMQILYIPTCLHSTASNGSEHCLNDSSLPY